MNKTIFAFLKLLETELANTIEPDTQSEMAKQIAFVSRRLAGRCLLEQNTIPAAREVAIAECAALLPTMGQWLDTPNIASLRQQLAEATANDWPAIELNLQPVLTQLLAVGKPEANRLASQFIAIDSRLRASKEQAFHDATASNSSAEQAWDIGRLSGEQQAALLAYIKQQYPHETQLEITNIKSITGGFSKQTMFIDFANTCDLPRSLVMQRDAPYERAGATSVAQEYRIIEQVYNGGVPVAKPYAIERSGKVLGTPFMLMAKVDGKSLGDALFIDERDSALAIDLARQTACLHKVPIGGLAHELVGGLISPIERMRAELTNFETIWQGACDQSYTMTAAYQWLRENIALADGDKVIVHRDLGMHNMLARDSRIVGIFDWETTVIGTRAEDLGYSYDTVCQLGDWDSYLAAYEQAAGLSVNKSQLDYYRLWGMVRIGASIGNLGYNVRAGNLDNMQLLYLGEYFGDTLMARIASLLENLLAETTKAHEY